MIAYLCDCGCIHGWQKHRYVRLVTRHNRSSMEDIWYCPGCGRQHRTFDGGAWGQAYKAWREVNPEKIKEDFDPRYGFILTLDGVCIRFCN